MVPVPMGTIKTTYDLPKNLTLAKAVGRMTADDFRKWNDDYYAGEVTLNCLWDLTQADLSDIVTGDLRDEAMQTRALADKRKGGKTALVAEGTVEFGISRMLEVFYELQYMPFAIEVFRTIDEAMKWLQFSDTDDG